MKAILLFFFIIGMTVLPAHAQYFGNLNGSKKQSLEEYIGPGMSPKQQLAERLDNDQRNAILVIAFGAPSVALIGFLVLRKRK